MKRFIVAGLIMLGALVSAVPKGTGTPAEIFPTAEAGTCTPRYGACNPVVRPNTSCCSNYCKATAPGAGVCL